MFKSLGLVLAMAFFVSTACAESVKQQKATASSGNKGTIQQRSQVNTPKEARMDTNKDGVVDEQEKIQARSIVDTPEEAKFDKNGDGVIDATEAKDFLKARQARPGPKGERTEANNTVE